jgi:hypothetical protein
MGSDATQWAMTHPSYMESEILLQQNQRSDFMNLLAGGAPRVRLGAEDKAVYLRSLGVKTAVSSGAHGANQLPSCSVTTGLASAPTYLQQIVAEYDHHQIAAMAAWGVSLPDAQRLAMGQGHYQGLRSKAIYGEQPQNGEGILNATGITTITLPADSFGNQNFSSYDNGSMALFLLGIFLALKTRTYQLGRPTRFEVLGPQRVIGLWEMIGIVQLTSYQRPGGGSAVIGELVKKILADMGDFVEFGYDDTLIGQGAGGTDAIIFNMPEIAKPDTQEGWDTNNFAKLNPGFRDCTVQYADRMAPLEIPAPMPNGATHILTEIRATSGWVTRPETVTVLSGPY